MHATMTVAELLAEARKAIPGDFVAEVEFIESRHGSPGDDAAP